MNPGLVGFEFYKVAHESEWKPLGRPLQTSWEFEGTFKVLPEWHYRARRMIKTMANFGFPQFIHLDARDFFQRKTAQNQRRIPAFRQNQFGAITAQQQQPALQRRKLSNRSGVVTIEKIAIQNGGIVPVPRHQLCEAGQRGVREVGIDQLLARSGAPASP